MASRPIRIQDLNPAQRAAALQVEGPVLILAGAGTGKTRVITTRIAYMVETGIPADSILAVTFTNKAAAEMRERVAGMIAKHASSKVTISTFHSLCVRILRSGIERLGYKRNFSIYTASDQVGLLRRIIVRLGGRNEKLDPYLAQGLISRFKNRGIPVAEADDDLMHVVQREYQRSLKLLNAVDFDDLLGLAVTLLREHPPVRAAWEDRFRYIMVDEFQDTNRPQMDLLQLLGRGHGNVCVVGDDDQSIYGWRGAEISNILEFERFFPDPKIVKLEENYRSTRPILEAANGLIRNNLMRRDKRLRSTKSGADKVRLIPMPGEKEEAESVATEIWEERRASGRSWEDFAVLFRMNSQSRLIEEAMRKLKIPYRVIGGQSFFERREVKDVLAYWRVVVNPDDDVNLLRIVNNPPRGISDTTIAAATDHSIEKKQSIFAAFSDPEFLGLLGTRAREAVGRFVELVELYQDAVAQPAAAYAELAERLIKEVGYMEALKRTCKTNEETESRERNVWEVLEALRDHHRSEGSGLGAFIESVALDDSREEEKSDISKQSGVCLITLHAAKGLEFPFVYLVGLEEGILPHQRSVEEGSRDEERRLLYVGITRAMEHLTLSYCRLRMRRGAPMAARPSTFLKELDPEHVEEISYDDLISEPAAADAAKDYFALMKERLARTEGIEP